MLPTSAQALARTHQLAAINAHDACPRNAGRSESLFFAPRIWIFASVLIA
jgi:hypothetical protein